MGRWCLGEARYRIRMRGAHDGALEWCAHLVDPVFRREQGCSRSHHSGRCYDASMGATDPAEPNVPLRFLLSGNQGSPIRRILVLGFSAIFGLWLISAYVLGQRVVEADNRVAAITTAFIEGEEVLFGIKERVLLSSILVRDAALTDGPEAGATSREQLQQIREDVERRLQQYRPNVDSPVEQEHWTRLAAELDEYWTSLSPLMTGHVNGSAAQAFVRSTVIPKRELVLRVSEDLRVLNQDALREQRTAVTELHRAIRERLRWTSGVAVVFGLGIALLATRYIGRLESWIRQQHRQEREHKRELQRLSADLEDAREHERRSIARDLHDEIGQALMTIKLDLGLVDRSVQLSGPPAAALTEARSSTDMAIQTVRDLSQLLHPPMLDDFGLAATLQVYVRGFSERTGVRTELVLDRMEARVPSQVEVCAYRVIQEALTNVAKHAHATSCRVYLHRLPYSLLATVEDDGKGMAGATADGSDTPRGVGLLSVRERVTRAGGTVNLESHVGRGTRLTVELPMSLADATDGGARPESSPAPAAVKT
jgi:signal transduction histidine kinase